MRNLLFRLINRKVVMTYTLFFFHKYSIILHFILFLIYILYKTSFVSYVF